MAGNAEAVILREDGAAARKLPPRDRIRGVLYAVRPEAWRAAVRHPFQPVKC